MKRALDFCDGGVIRSCVAVFNSNFCPDYLSSGIFIRPPLAPLHPCTLAPLHQPHNLAEIRNAASFFPGVPQVACFDTAFHTTMPKHERMLGLPRAYFDRGMKRYGFHG